MASADGRDFVSNRSQERSPVGAGDDGERGRMTVEMAGRVRSPVGAGDDGWVGAGDDGDGRSGRP